VRGFLVGLILIPLVVLTLLSLRPGGLRQQLRNMVRRFKLALALAAVYLVGSGILRVAFGDSTVSEYGIPILALLLAVVFVVVGQDPKPDQLERR
jgi:hypothetical protein